MKIKRRSQFPKWIRNVKELKGIFVGGCVDKNVGIGDDHIAHAHSANGDPYQGWICLRLKFHLTNKLTMLHEVAHLIANKMPATPPHGRKWKQALLELGGTFKAFQYRRAGKTYKNLDYTYRNRKQ